LKEDSISRTPLQTVEPKEKALLIGVDVPGSDWSIQESFEELARLAETVDVEVVGSVAQRMPHAIPGTYFGKGKLEEVKELKESLEYDIVIVDDELTPAQLKNLEAQLDVLILDRTALILDVFARRAQTHEGRLQVELAQLEYRLPRLTRMWTHLSRQSRGGVGVRGPGETQLESDKREAGKRISQIKRELSEVHRHRQLYRDYRREKQAPVVALVGYTNAGKSTLLNAITGSTVLSEDKLFATLDPTTRRTSLPSGRQILLTDTVGFINNLPTMLVAAFRATLEEINEAAVLIHVVDITHPNVAEQIATVNQVLEELGADGKPMLVALNKIDVAEEDGPVSVELLRERLELTGDVVPISAVRATGLDELLAAIERMLEVEQAFVPVTLVIPYNRSDLVDRVHKLGRVESSSFDERGTTLTGVLPEAMVGAFAPYVALVSTTETAPDVPRPAPSESAA
jgi:GTPase